MEHANPAESEFLKVGSYQRSAEGWHAIADKEGTPIAVDVECSQGRNGQKPCELRQVLGTQRALMEQQRRHLPL
jgi:hypothetical protein